VSKKVRGRLHGFVQFPLDPSVAQVAKRFTIRLVMLLILAALPIAGGIGFHRMVIALTGANAIMCAVWGLLRREKINGIGLTHWDEALVMAGLWLGAHLV
jgi:hypothetical protein